MAERVIKLVGNILLKKKNVHDFIYIHTREKQENILKMQKRICIIVHKQAVMIFPR